MFTRVLEFTPKPEMTEKLKTTITNEVLPILQKYPGFVDMVTLMPEKEFTPFITMSFWNTREMAEEYQKKDFPKIMEMIKPFMKEMPKVTYYTVATSTFHKVATAA